VRGLRERVGFQEDQGALVESATVTLRLADGTSKASISGTAAARRADQ